MSDEDKTFSGSFVLDLRIWWRQAHTLYKLEPYKVVLLLSQKLKSLGI